MQTGSVHNAIGQRRDGQSYETELPNEFSA
jgi:hypothetical protein